MDNKEVKKTLKYLFMSYGGMVVKETSRCNTDELFKTIEEYSERMSELAYKLFKKTVKEGGI